MAENAVFFDRDGTLNEDPGYLGDPDQVKLFPNTGKALSVLKNKYKFKLFVISNQSGIARGIISEEDVKAVNDRINSLLNKEGAEIDEYYYCPHHPEYSAKEECNCRKPSPALVFKAAEEHNIQLSGSYFVGDKLSDIECGINAGLKTVLVKTGYGTDTFSLLKKENIFPSFVAVDIEEACRYIIQDFSGVSN